MVGRLGRAEIDEEHADLRRGDLGMIGRFQACLTMLRRRQTD
jgi:hypothetical protein